MSLRRDETTPSQKAAEAKLKRQASIKRAQEAKAVKVQQKKLVEQKVEQGLPISEEERRMLLWNAGNMHGTTKEKLAMAAVAKLVMKPQSVNELRLLVEKTAAKHGYNPIESLIELTNSPDVEEKEKIAIHKALLPFLVPVLATPKATNGEEGGGGVKVVVTQFQFPPRSASGPLHLEKPKTVETTAEQQT